MQIYSKNNKNCFFSLISWPIFILFVLSDRARWRLQNLYTKFWNSLIMLIYANLRRPGRDPGGAIGFFFFFFFFMSLPGRHIYIFLTLIFLFLVPSRGIKCLFFDQYKIVPHEICDIWCCEMPDERYVIDVLVASLPPLSKHPGAAPG